jgi:hypothetical protein
MGASRSVIMIGLWLLLCQLPVNFSVTQASSDNGPTFSEYADFYADFVNESGCVWFHVTVTDADGVAQVIGSTRRTSEQLWHNLSLTVSESNADRYYGNYSVTLPQAGSVIYEVKYYAVDTLGNWNVSESTLHHLNNLGLNSSYPSVLLTIAVAAAVVAMISFAVILRRRQV